MKLVIVKHENCNQKFLFKVPNGENIYAGDLVMVNNKRGKSLAICMCDSFSMNNESEEYKSVLAAFGASEPLASVVGKYYFSQFKKTEMSDDSCDDASESAI